MGILCGAMIESFTPASIADVEEIRMDTKQASVPERLPLEKMRKRKGFSAHKLAQAANISVATVRAIELGNLKRTPRYETMEAIAKALEIDPREINWPGDPYALE